MIRRSTQTERGLTLMEVMFAMLVVSFLASLAYPTMERDLAYSKRTEAFLGLGTLVRAEKKYHDLNKVYTDQMNLLEFAMERGGPIGPSAYQGGRYVFSIQLLDDRGEHFLASASGDIDGDEFTDLVVALR